MTAIATSPFPIYLDVDGSALENGYLYFGVAGQNPETNPITVYWDSTFQTPAAQPIRTSGGYAVRNGSPAMVYFSAFDYSITVRDKNRRLVYSKLSTDSAAAQQLELPVADVFTGNGATTVYTLSKTPSGQASLHVSIGGVTQTPGVDYTLTNGSKILTFTSAPPSGTTIVVLYGQSSEALSQISYTIQSSIATAGQTVFNLTNQYTPGANTLAVYLNGLRLTVVSDYAETSTSSITLTAGAVAGDELLFVTGSTEINPVSITASAVAYTPAGTGAVATDVQSKLRESVSVLDFGADPLGVADSTAAIQAAINYATTRALVGGTVYLPPGSYKTSSTITTGGPGNVGQVAIVGAGQFSTRFLPSGDFTVLRLVTSNMTSGDFSIEWATQDAATIPATRIGVELASANYQFSLATLRNTQVRGAYRGYVLNDWTAQPLGTTWLASLEKCHAVRCADWGIYINSKAGSTTLRLMQCYVRGDNAVGGAQYGKGIYINNVNEILFEQCAIDQCLNQWMSLVNYNIAVFNSIAFEGNRMSSAAAVAVSINGSQNVINGFKDIVNVFDTGGNARVIYMGGNATTLSICGYNEQFSTVAGGTTKYRIGFNSATSLVSVLDRSVVPSQVLNNGWVINAVYEGRRLSVNGLAPASGTWLRGDYVKNGAPAVGSPKGWYCTVAGTPGTWVSEGNL